MNTATIYALLDPRDDSIHYVGCTTQPIKMRLRHHIWTARTQRENNPKALWIRSLLDAEIKPIARSLEVVPLDKASDIERDWIAKVKLDVSDIVNERNSSAPPVGGKHMVDWTPEIDARLGKEADAIIADDLGVSRKAVSYRREKLGIPASYDQSRMKPPPPMGGWNKIDLSPEITGKLGTMPDYVLAAEIGVDKSMIARARRERNIPSFAEQTGNDGKYHLGNYPSRWLK